MMMAALTVSPHSSVPVSPAEPGGQQQHAPAPPPPPPPPTMPMVMMPGSPGAPPPSPGSGHVGGMKVMVPRMITMGHHAAQMPGPQLGGHHAFAAPMPQMAPMQPHHQVGGPHSPMAGMAAAGMAAAQAGLGGIVPQMHPPPSGLGFAPAALVHHPAHAQYVPAHPGHHHPAMVALAPQMPTSPMALQPQYPGPANPHSPVGPGPGAQMAGLMGQMAAAGGMPHPHPQAMQHMLASGHQGGPLAMGPPPPPPPLHHQGKCRWR